MKNLICLGLLLTSILSFAQIREKGDIEITPIIGYSSSYQLHSLLLGSSSISGIQFGAYGDYYFNNRWSLHSGLLFQKMGADKIDIAIFQNDYSERTHYLSVPITINYHFGSNRNWYLNYGTSIGFLTNAEANYHDGNGFTDITNTAKAVQFGLNGGIGYKFNISPKLILAIDNANFVGLTKTTEEKDGKNFLTSFNLGLVFKL